MIIELKQANFLRKDYTTRIQIYYDDQDNNIYVEKTFINGTKTMTNDKIPFDKEIEADIIFQYYCNIEMQKWI